MNPSLQQLSLKEKSTFSISLDHTFMKYNLVINNFEAAQEFANSLQNKVKEIEFKNKMIVKFRRTKKRWNHPIEMESEGD